MPNNRFVCRICGYLSSEEFYDEKNCASYTICKCCGCESGYEDSTIISIYNYRKNWIFGKLSFQKEDKKSWFSPAYKPKSWNKEEQIKNIPKNFL